ncbi:MAG: UDP-N-acetylmuramoyl-tripeptide--D-alanyl-D-alanine ligase [Candidatus Neptunochlamydia sp.]|nr:UDP-N-acetylmuramoyl-tripeptide--D-alanyl-D-alanine ligase [Candidatus Neptunochlamydia sp.]
MKKSVSEIAEFFGSLSNREGIVAHTAFDSRQVREGTLFFALTGEKVDGHQFLEEVARKGAIAAIVSKKYSGPSFGMELIPVSDVRKALQSLAREIFKDKNPLVIGVTGTVGKTTAKEFIAGVLSERFRVAKNPGSMNSQVGVPLTILSWEGNDEILVLEMGMSEEGELSRLIEIAPPELCVLTKISLAHSVFFNDLNGIVEAKCELFKSKKIKHAFLNQDTAGFKAVQEIQSPKTWFGECTLQAPFSESQLLENLGAAVSIARYLGMTEEEILKGIQKLKPFKRRGEKIEKNGVLFIDDSYNSSPVAAKAAFKSMPEGKNRFALFGAMKELGPFEKESHLEVAEYAFPIIDALLCVGKECQPMVDFFKRKGKLAKLFASKEEATKHLKDIMEGGDVVLLKGSNSFKLWTVLEEI